MAHSNTVNDDYDEFGMLSSYAAFEGLPWHGRPHVERRFVDAAQGQRISAICWESDARGASSGSADLLFLHGGGQNSHTWDSVALALDRPLVAIDLPGHGHSDWRADHDYGPVRNAETIAAVADQLASVPATVIGMSMGGLTAICLAARHPQVVERAVIIDVTPSVGARSRTMSRGDRGATALISGQDVFESFDAMLSAVAETVPGRPRESLRTGVRHNARQLEDGTWTWRYDRRRGGHGAQDTEQLWTDLSEISVPVMLVRGQRSAFVHDDDAAAFVRRLPGTRVEVVANAGHSVQSDQARELARLIDEFIAST